ncbi:MAG TPA: hypothetical protein VFZ53_20540 [Polyangiaceae bacterium]
MAVESVARNRRARVPRGPALLLACLAGIPGSALGAPSEPDVAFSLAYDPPADCPPAPDFEGAILSRAAGARITPPGAAAVRFDVELRASPSETAAVLVTVLPDGTQSRRDVTAASCSEAVAALAVIAALAVNGYREAKSADPRPTNDGAAATPTPTVAAENRAPPHPPPSPVPVDAGPAKRPVAHPTSAARPGVFAGATWESAVAPQGALGGTAGAELGWAPSGAWWPSVRAGVLATLPGSETTADGSATFRVTAARVGFCPLGWGGPSTPSVRACAELDGGVLTAQASGSGVSDLQDQSMPWLAAGVAGRGEWPLSAWFSLEASFGVRGLALHDRFVFRPQTLVYDVPPVSAGLCVGVAARVP